MMEISEGREHTISVLVDKEVLPLSSHNEPVFLSREGSLADDPTLAGGVVLLQAAVAFYAS